MSSPLLRVYAPDDRLRTQRTETKPANSDERAAWTWEEFFELHYSKVLLANGGSPHTVDRYYETLRYWRAINGNVTLGETRDGHGVAFASDLPKWGFSRSGQHVGEKMRIGLLSRHPDYYPLSATTVSGHVSRMTTLYRMAGPRPPHDPHAQPAGILPSCPYMPAPATKGKAKRVAKPKTKGAFDLETCRSIFAACDKMLSPTTPDWITTAEYWRAIICLFFYSGQRSGTVFGLKVSHLERRGDGLLWINAPGEIVKTGKAEELPLHPFAESYIAKLIAGREADELLVPEVCCYRYLSRLHLELQALAGMPEEKRLSFQGWRRTYAQLTGLTALCGEKMASLQLSHSDVRVTQSGYLGSLIKNFVRLQMPPLVA
jgi:integrase